MGNIVLLDELTINQIAAGEVIERPASVIKEMVENSIDAGASQITVEIKNGGISYIKVTDNGKGIAQDDLEMAFERHATSKIRSASDLNNVTSMGFRGEALASIAAISKVEMISTTAEQETGYKVVVEAGDVLEKEETGCQTGTSITVSNLFFNTPVRYKFLKKDYTESGYIEDVITRIALVNPNIAFKFINTGKTIIQTNGNGDLKSVVYAIYGKDVANSILEVSYPYEDVKITGVIGKPDIARSNRSNQLFFVNKRYIKDKTLTAATEQAYKGLIPIGKFGFVVLNIEMNPAKVDVNVHPAKLEVRFEEENKIFQSIYHAIKDTLLKSELVGGENSRETTFEERLRLIQENKKEQMGNGLFGFRKQKEHAIEKYTDEESKIKTNSIDEVTKDNVNISSANIEEKVPNIAEAGKPINTEDVLAQLKNLKEKMQKDLEMGDNSVADNSEDYIIDNSDINRKLEEDNKKDMEIIDKILDEHLRKQREIIYGKDIPLDDKLNNDENKEQSEKNDEEIAQKDVKNVENNIENDGQADKDQTKKIETMEELPKAMQNKNFEEVKEKIEDLDNNTQVVLEDFNEMYTKMFGTKPIDLIEKEKKEEQKVNAIDLVQNNVSIFDDEAEKVLPTYKFIGIVFNTYIILEIDQQMYILDQHAAHERIMYEKVKKNYYSDTDKDSQMLLLPDVITLTHKEMEICRENVDLFTKAGFTLEEFGENTIKLTGVPSICLDLDTKELFLETLDEINTVARTAKQEKEEKFIATVACKSAVKANMALTEQEVHSLMEKLLQLPNPFTCPHGRPTVIKMTKYDIERKFARK